MIILNYSSSGFSGDIEAIIKELAEMSKTTLRIECEDKSAPKNNILALRQDATSYLEKIANGKQIVVDLPGYGEKSFYENEIAYIETIDLQVEINEI